MAGSAVKGRSILLVWASCPKNVWQEHKSQNGFEEALLLTLLSMIPRSVKVMILADRPGICASSAPRFPRVGRFGQNVAVCWKKARPEKRDERWCLMSDLCRRACELV